MSEDIIKYIGEEPLGYCFDDLSGREFWKSILGSYWHVDAIDEALDLPMAQCVLLYGPYGSGKNTLVQAMAGEMVQGGYQYLELDFLTIPKEKIRSVFKLLKSDYIHKNPTFLFLNHLDRLKDVQVLWHFYEWANEGDVPVIVAGVVEDETILPSDIRKLFHAYYIGYPDKDDRKAYFEDNLASLFENTSIQGMSKLLDATEGYSYVQMEAFVQRMKLRVKYDIIKNGKTADLALAWLQAEMIEEILAKSSLPQKEQQGIPDMSAIVQALASVSQVQNMQGSQVVQTESKDPLSDLRSKYNPKKVFDQGLMFVKDSK